MGIFAPALRRTLQELRDDPEGRVVRKDVRSADWDGGTDLSSGPDTAATKGYFADYSAGRIQIETLYIGGVATAAVLTSETTASTSYTDLATAGPSVTVTTGIAALVTITAEISNTGQVSNYVGYEVSGATTTAVSDERKLRVSGPATVVQQMSASYLAVLTAGSNTFKLVYKTDGGTATFLRRSIIVIPY